jgi:hypothetical protein
MSSVSDCFSLMRAWLLSVSCLLVFIFVSRVDAQSFSPNERFVGMLADGTRIQADVIKEWHEDNARPNLAGHAIFDQNRPVRWIIDQAVPLAEKPTAYVEMFGGDRLPCRVVDYQRSEKWSYEALGEYLIVEPLIDVDFPGRPKTPFLRLSTEWLKRVVFDQKAGIPTEWQPGTVFLHDGSRIAYRVVRWSNSGLSVLTDSGVKSLLYSQVAELHLPRRNTWDVYFEQLAVLSPDLSSRLLQVETSGGLQITASTDRFSARHSGDQSKSENWFPLLHPAWSLDAITVPVRTVRTWRFFSPDQPPMTLFEPEATRDDPVFSTGWNWLSNLSVQSKALRNNRLPCGWGFGVHAPTSLAFPLHPVVRQVRSQTGLDQVVGPGGCVRAELALQSAATQPFYRSEILIGNEKSADSGWRNVSVAAGKSDQLLMTADPVLTERPKGADPFDVRDCLNWLEPEWKLDRTQLLREVSSRISARLPVQHDWTISAELPLLRQGANGSAASSAKTTSPHDALLVRNAWDRTVPEDEHVRMLIKPTGAFVVFSQQTKVDQQHRWLALCISKPIESTDTATVMVRIDGRVMAEADVPVRTTRLDPDPILVPVSEFQGRESLIEIVLLSTGEKSLVDWRGVVFTEIPPGIAPLFDESGELISHLSEGEGQLSLSETEPQHGARSLRLTSGDRSNAAVPNFKFAISEHPRLGEYRFLRFAWKKNSGTRIGFQLAHDGEIGIPDNEFGRARPRAFAEGVLQAAQRRQQSSPRRPVSGASRGSQFGYQYDAGTGEPVQSVLRLDRKLPTDWRMMQRDLFGEFGSFNLTGLGFQCSDDEPAWFDQIYLARQQSDFNWIDEISGVNNDKPSADSNVLTETHDTTRFASVVSKVASQFSTTASGEGIQWLGEFQGRKNVLCTMPPSKEKACVLRAPVSVRRNVKTVLRIAAGRHPEGDWQLIVRVAGQELYRSMVDANTAKDGWLDHDVDLSRFGDQNVVVEVLNEATGWHFEHGFWNRLEIVEQ